MNALLWAFAAVLVTAVAALVFHLPILGNLLFIAGLTGFILLFFRDFDPDTATEAEKVRRKRWLTVCGVAMVLGLLFGSLWNSHIIAPPPAPGAPNIPSESGMIPGQ